MIKKTHFLIMAMMLFSLLLFSQNLLAAGEDYEYLVGEYEQTGFEVYGPKGMRVFDQDSYFIPENWNGQIAVSDEGLVEGSMFIEGMMDAVVSYQILEVDGNNLYVSSPLCEKEADWIEVTQDEEEYVLTFKADFCQAVPPENCCGWTNLIYKKK